MRWIICGDFMFNLEKTSLISINKDGSLQLTFEDGITSRIELEEVKGQSFYDALKEQIKKLQDN